MTRLTPPVTLSTRDLDWRPLPPRVAEHAPPQIHEQLNHLYTQIAPMLQCMS